MRIVHLIDYYQSALGYQESNLAREQLKLGHEVTVITADRYAPYPDYERTIEPVLGKRIRGPGKGLEDGVLVIRLPVIWEQSFRCWLRGVGAVLDRLQPDVVHAHCVVKFTALQIVHLKRRRAFRLVMDDHMHRVNLNNKTHAGRLFYWIFRKTAAKWLTARTDAFVATTEETAGIMREVFGLDYPPIEVIELGVDTHLFQPNASQRKDMRSQLGISPEEFLIVHTGKLIPNKAPHWLVESLPHCVKQVKVLLVGNAPEDYLNKMQGFIEEHHLQQRVLFRPAVRQSELPRYYAAADAACWPREASLAMLEAAACALPIIITAGGLSDRICYGNGLEYPEGNIEALADCIRRLVLDLESARQMGQQGRRLVEDYYSWAIINQKFMKLYEG